MITAYDPTAIAVPRPSFDRTDDTMLGRDAEVY